MKKIYFNIFFATVFLVLGSSISHSVVKMDISENCPCSNPNWCNIITTKNNKEVFAFSVENNQSYWDLFPWPKLTTIATYYDPTTNIMCVGHSHGVRVVRTEVPPMDLMLNVTLRNRYVDNLINKVLTGFLDGVDFDFEARIDPNAHDQREAYTATVAAVYQRLKAISENYQISIAVSWQPNDLGRYYDYYGLSQVSDFFFIMAYDEPLRKEYQAGPNSGLDFANKGLDLYENYSDGKIEANKLVLGVPWYGYKYECAEVFGEDCYRYLETSTDINVGKTPGINYKDALPLLMTMPETYRWNVSSSTPYFTYKDGKTNKTYQIQYDDPWSIMMKYRMARLRGLHGVGMWTIDDTLDYSQTSLGKQMRLDMFNTFDAFLGEL